MSVNGTNNSNFKVSTVGSEIPENWKAQETDVNEEIDDLFDTGTGEDTTGTSTDPLDDYTCGEMTDGAYNSGTDTAGAAQLDHCVPGFEELLATNEKLIHYLPLVMKRYEQLQGDLRALKDQYEQAIQSGTMTNEELQAINIRLPIIDQALAACKEEMEKVEASMTELDKVHLDEQRHMKDLNNDGWIGPAYMSGSYLLQHNDDGTITYIDPISKKAVPCPISDPDYGAMVTQTDSMSTIDAADSIASGTEHGTTDLYLKLNESALTGSSNFAECPLGITIPPFFWVERDMEGTGSNIYAMEFDEEQCEEKMKIYNSWDESGGLRQQIPSDLSRYAQVKVTGVKIRSVECAKTGDGQPVYRHVVEYYNDQTLICRMSVEGCYTDSENAATCDLASGYSYIAASSVGFSVEGPELAAPVEIDASGFISTGRHVYSALEGEIGIGNPGDGEKCDMSYEENVDMFTKKDYKMYEWDAQAENPDWDHTSQGINSYGSLNDQYMSELDEPDAGESATKTFRTGIYFNDVRGDIRGTNYNDVIVCRGVDDHSDYAKEHMPEDSWQIKKGDAFYTNYVNAGGGNDIVVAGRGDNFIDEATFVWIKNSGNMDENFVRLPNMPQPTTYDASTTISPNQKNFVCVDGGHTRIYNPDEWKMADAEDAEDEEEATKNDPSYEDDYYWVKSGSVEFANPDDLDVLDSVGATSSTQGFSAELFDQLKSDPYGLWYDELVAVPDPNDINTEIDIDEILGSQTDLENEMNGFFDEMFGDMSSFLGEWEEEQALPAP